MLLQRLAKNTLIALTNNITNQITAKDTELDLKHKASSGVLARISAKFSVLKEAVQNKMDATSDKLSDEYKNLMTELKNLKEEESKAKEKQEEIMSYCEDKIQREKQVLQDRLQAVEADKEGWDSSMKDNISKTCAPFANS